MSWELTLYLLITIPLVGLTHRIMIDWPQRKNCPRCGAKREGV